MSMQVLQVECWRVHPLLRLLIFILAFHGAFRPWPHQHRLF
jgi:hypothetical protein